MRKYANIKAPPKLLQLQRCFCKPLKMTLVVFVHFSMAYVNLLYKFLKGAC